MLILCANNFLIIDIHTYILVYELIILFCTAVLWTGYSHLLSANWHISIVSTKKIQLITSRYANEMEWWIQGVPSALYT